MENLLRAVPKQTLIFITSAVLVSALVTFKILPEQKIVFSSLIWKKLQIWRVFSSFFYHGTFSLGTSIHFLLYFSCSKEMETRGSGQYFYFNLLIGIISLLTALVLNIPFLSDIHFQAVVYIECRRNRHGRIALFGLPVQISAAYLPYINLLLNYSTGALVGMILGHIYYYFEDTYPKLPASRNKKPLNAPIFILNLADLFKL
jgi:Derlin-2/3